MPLLRISLPKRKETERWRSSREAYSIPVPFCSARKVDEAVLWLVLVMISQTISRQFSDRWLYDISSALVNILIFCHSIAEEQILARILLCRYIFSLLLEL